MNMTRFVDVILLFINILGQLFSERGFEKKYLLGKNICLVLSCLISFISLNETKNDNTR